MTFPTEERKYIISEICGDWALHIKGSGTSNNFLFFKSRNNAELVKSILEWEDAHPNEAVPYKPTLTPPNEWVSVEERLPARPAISIRASLPPICGPSCRAMSGTGC